MKKPSTRYYFLLGIKEGVLLHELIPAQDPKEAKRIFIHSHGIPPEAIEDGSRQGLSRRGFLLARPPKNENIIGSRFGRLLVLDTKMKVLKHKRTRKAQYCVCSCDCGELKEIKSTSLLDGTTRSCGCYQIEKLKERNAERLARKAASREAA